MGLLSQLFWEPPPAPETIDLTSKVAIVTGANRGLGYEVCKQLLDRKLSHLILAVRNAQSGDHAKTKLLKETNRQSDCQIDVWELEMSSFQSCLALGKRVESLERLDIVVLNAGVFLTEWTTSKETGNETSLQINHLSNALLSLLLLPKLRTTSQRTQSPSHLTVVSTDMYSYVSYKERKAPNILARANDQKFFNGRERYPLTKLLSLLWFVELASKVDSQQVIINAVNPGFAVTDLHRDLPAGMYATVLKTMKKLFARNAEAGGRFLMYAAAVAGKESHGQFLWDNKVARLGRPIRSEDDAKKQRERIWTETMNELVQVAPSIREQV